MLIPYEMNEKGLFKTSPDERLKKLQTQIELMLKKMEENRIKHNRPENLEKMVDSELFEEKQELQQLLLEFEDQFGRPKERIEKDIVRKFYDRYKIVKMALAERDDRSLANISRNLANP